jgi:hypothetical protein
MDAPSPFAILRLKDTLRVSTDDRGEGVGEIHAESRKCLNFLDLCGGGITRPQVEPFGGCQLPHG